MMHAGLSLVVLSRAGLRHAGLRLGRSMLIRLGLAGLKLCFGTFNLM